MNCKQIVFFACILSSFLSLAQNHGTREDREALFDYILSKTEDREARSSIKEKNFGIDVMEEMESVRAEFLAAQNDTELYYAIQKLSAKRKDRHLSVDVIEGGLVLPEIDKGQAPIRFYPDFGEDEVVFFVADLGTNINKGSKNPQLGDILLSVNGEPIADYMSKVSDYTRFSTWNNFYVRFGYSLGQKSDNLPPSFFKEDLTLTLKKSNGKTYVVTLPYMDEVEWQRGWVDKSYDGFKKVEAFKFDSFELYVPTDKKNKTLLLWWYGFRGDLPDAADALIEYASANDLLDYDLIIDAINSRGGSQGAYALARLTSVPFRTTGGNLKLSDITGDFIDGYTDRYLSRKAIMDGDGRETEDDGTWAIDWLHGPVLKGLAAGQEYSNNTPFKCAHLPHYSDWMMAPADKHFTGKMVALFGPWGGSHLTQFSSMIIDNQLGYTIGMPDGGYSNTWEWEEDLVFPTTGKPVASFMWSIGHTIRPNGQVAEGNPPMVDEYIPVTKKNYFNYKSTLVEKALDWLKESK